MGNWTEATARTNLNAGSTLLELWHLCSLDAPTVAVLWLVFAARTAPTALPPHLPVMMFLAVWIVYAVDRLLDGRSASGLEARHHFHAQHVAVFVPAVLVGGGFLFTLLAGGGLPHLLLERYLGLAAGLLLWLAVVHLLPGSHALPKEFSTGIFFSAAIFLPLLGGPKPILLHAILFAALCTLNCLLIRGWESRRHARALQYGIMGLLALSLLDHSEFGLAVTLALICLLALHLRRRRFAPTVLRAAADLALLTPLLVLSWPHLL